MGLGQFLKSREIEHLNKTVTSLNERIGQLEQENQNLVQENRTLNQENLELKHDNRNLKVANTDLRSQITHLERQVGEANKKLQDADLACGGKFDELISKYHRLKNNLLQMESAYNSNKLHLCTDDEYIKLISTYTHDPNYIDMDYKSLSVPTLRKLIKQTQSQIKDCYQTYNDAYDNFSEKTENSTFALIKQLIDLKLNSVISSLKYGKLSNALSEMDTALNAYMTLGTCISNRLHDTMPWYIGKMKALCADMINIEYTYYTEQERIKEEQRAIKEQMKQEAEERKQLEKERKKIEKEESKYTAEIDNIKSQLLSASDNEVLKLQARITELENLLNEVQNKREQILTLENGKAGYVYIISNIGSFGNDVYKIGMTRRLEPMERVSELSNASVPFPFDVHSFIFSDDAVQLEHDIHETLSEKRVNKINTRKEFFRITIDEVEALVEQLCPTAEFHRTALAEQYRLSMDETI